MLSRPPLPPLPVGGPCAINPHERISKLSSAIFSSGTPTSLHPQPHPFRILPHLHLRGPRLYLHRVSSRSSLTSPSDCASRGKSAKGASTHSPCQLLPRSASPPRRRQFPSDGALCHCILSNCVEFFVLTLSSQNLYELLGMSMHCVALVALPDTVLTLSQATTPNSTLTGNRNHLPRPLTNQQRGRESEMAPARHLPALQ